MVKQQIVGVQIDLIVGAGDSGGHVLGSLNAAKLDEGGVLLNSLAHQLSGAGFSLSLDHDTAQGIKKNKR